MGDVLSVVGIAVLLVLLVVSVRRVRAQTVTDQMEADSRVGDATQQERSARHRADVRTRPPSPDVE